MAFSPSTSGCPGPRHCPNRFQNRLVHLLRIKAEASGVRLHDGDSANESFATLALFLKFFGQFPDLAFEVVLLDRGADDEHVLSLQLLSRVDLAIESVLVQGGRADPEDGGD